MSFRMSQRKKFSVMLLAVMSLIIYAVITKYSEDGAKPYQMLDGETGSLVSGDVTRLDNVSGKTDEEQDDASTHALPLEVSRETGRHFADNGTSDDGVVDGLRDKESNLNPDTIPSNYARPEGTEREKNDSVESTVVERLEHTPGSGGNSQLDGGLSEGKGDKEPLGTEHDPKSSFLPKNTGNHSSPADANLTEAQRSPSPKTVLFYGTFFQNPWQDFVRKMILLKEQNCPVTNCVFIYNSSHPEDADAIIFHATTFDGDQVPQVRRPHQRYIWLNLEAPRLEDFIGSQAPRKHKEKAWADQNRFFNWTFSYHRDSDLFLPYNGLRPLRDEGSPPRPGILDTSGDTYRDYMEALHRGDSLQDDPDWLTFLNRPKLVAWMVSHCSTSSGREFYVRELKKYVSVDVFGLCGNLRCGKRHTDWRCYTDVLRPTYKFYLAFENSMCVDYLTEKVWLPMMYGLVPVVYGGANYTHFLPPHSYVDATNMTPAQLAQLLVRAGNSSLEYGRYHIWRRYWQVMKYPPMCELCQKLHQDHASSAVSDLAGWWTGVNQCYTRYPPDQYPRPPEPDPRTFLQKFRDVARAFGTYLGVKG
ncbi:alpha-(1,3)-fucosyltransferase C-like [Panulirus ornatus]|uniref:alpha-(1,3)-fucosyltransferase C-like n=1 Tax=Panulirus ornatus TaxID=150431 RepID=UPI003A8AB7D8